jgi:hypothetical protein
MWSCSKACAWNSVILLSHIFYLKAKPTQILYLIQLYSRQWRSETLKSGGFSGVFNRER